MSMQEDFGGRVRRYRKAAHLTQQELAEKVGVTPSAVRAWESNTARPRLDKMDKLAQIFGLSTAELMGESVVSDLSWDESELLASYRMLSAEDRLAVLGDVRRLAGKISGGGAFIVLLKNEDASARRANGLWKTLRAHLEGGAAVKGRKPDRAA